MDFREAAPILEAVGMAEARDVPLDPVQLAVELELTVCEVGERLECLEAYGLLDEEEPVPVLLTAGRQYLREKGATEPEVLAFLPEVFDDLNARRAVLAGGSVLVEELASGVAEGGAVELAQSLVPAVFARRSRGGSRSTCSRRRSRWSRGWPRALRRRASPRRSWRSSCCATRRDGLTYRSTSASWTPTPPRPRRPS